MSFDPITVWVLRCDGRVPAGQCPTQEHAPDELGDPEMVLRSKPALHDFEKTSSTSGWEVLPDGTVLCPQHSFARAQLAEAEQDGLPFPAPEED